MSTTHFRQPMPMHVPHCALLAPFTAQFRGYVKSLVLRRAIHVVGAIITLIQNLRHFHDGKFDNQKTSNEKLHCFEINVMTNKFRSLLLVVFGFSLTISILKIFSNLMLFEAP